MFVLPYFHAIRKTGDKTIHMLYLFLGNGGGNLLHIEGDPEKFCSENDLPISEIFQESQISFVKVNTATLHHEAFYTFHEPDTEHVEVWKTFLWIAEDQWNTNDSFKGILLNGISLYSILETILRHDA
jgi:hypothetical protein